MRSASGCVGQGEAVQAVSKAVRRARGGPAGPKTGPRAPSSSSGPTGVPARAELTKALAEFLFDERNPALSPGVTCPNNMEKAFGFPADRARPPAYVGYEMEAGCAHGKRLRRGPYQGDSCSMRSRKATRCLQCLLLQDAWMTGRLTDGQGRYGRYVRKHASHGLSLTSNLGSEYLAGAFRAMTRWPILSAMTSMGVGPVGLSAGVPEPDRRDHPVSPVAPVRKIGPPFSSTFQLSPPRQLLVDRKIDVELDDDARAWLAEKALYPFFMSPGPLKRGRAGKYVQDPLAEKILLGEVGEGSNGQV